MATCPSCKSSRLRAGYRPVAFPLRWLGIRELLCDDCNYLYRTFSPVPPKSGRRKNPTVKADTFMPAQSGTAGGIGDSIPLRYAKVEAKAPPSKPVQSPRPAKRPNVPARQREIPISPRLEPAMNPASKVRSSSSPECVYCGSNDTRRRSRKLWERTILAFSSKRPYLCNGCGKSFFAVKTVKSQIPTA